MTARLVPARDRAGRDHRVGQRHPGGALAAEHHPPSGVVVHGDDPGPAVGPRARGPGRVTAGGDFGVQRRDRGVQGLVPSPAAGQPGADPDPGVDRARGAQRGEHQPGRAGPQPRPGRQRSLVQVEHARLAERGHRVAALQGGHLVQGHAAAQGGGQHAARAGPDDHVDVTDRDVQALLHGVQGPGHPGRAHHPAGPEHQAGARPPRRGTGSLPGTPDAAAFSPCHPRGPHATSPPGDSAPGQPGRCYHSVKLRYTRLDQRISLRGPVSAAVQGGNAAAAGWLQRCRGVATALPRGG